MAKQHEADDTEVPEGYTPEQWAAYRADPVTFCIAELESTDTRVRFNAVDILRGCAGDAKAAIPALCELLAREAVATVRAQCVWALQDICEQVDARSAKRAVAPLAAALRDEDAEVRALAAAALGAMGTRAKEAAPALAQALEDRNAEVREAAADALEQVGR